MRRTEEKTINKKQGITLIALVITIIVLLILAGVSIATLTGENGILTKVVEAKEEAKYGQASEEVELAVQAVRLEYQGNGKKFTISEESALDIETELKKLSKDGTVYVDGNVMYSQNRGYIFEIDEGMKVIKSTFEMVEGNVALWQQVDGVLTAYKGDISELDGKTLVIPNYVDGIRIKEIGEFLFGGKIELPLQVEIKISEGIKVIGVSSFAGCTGLVGELKIPDSVTAIKSGAFASCAGFTGDMTISSNVTILESGAFANCTGFNGKLTIGIKEIPERFMSNSFSSANFTELVLLEGVETVGEEAFAGYKSILTARIPSTLENMGANAFRIEEEGITKTIYVDRDPFQVDNWDENWLMYEWDYRKNPNAIAYVFFYNQSWRMYQYAYWYALYYSPSNIAPSYHWAYQDWESMNPCISVVWTKWSTTRKWFQPFYDNGFGR